MAYEMLTGTKPFPIIFAVRVEAIRQGLTPPPSLAAPIASALVRAMQAAPADRFPSMRELINALRTQPLEPKRSRAPIIASLGIAAVGAALVGAWQITKAPEDDGKKPVQVAANNAAPIPTATPPIAIAPDASVPATPQPSAPDVVAAVPAPVAVTVKKQPRPAAPKQKIEAAETTPPAPAPAAPATAAGSNAGLTPRQQQILDSMDPPYCRSCAIASVDAFCEIPYDVANPETKRRREVVDWGKVTKIATEKGSLGERPVTLNIITLQGQRDTYRFKDELLVGRLQTQVGALLAICPEEEDDFWQLSGGPTFKTRAVITLSAPPKLAEAAKYQAIHIPDIRLAAAGVNKNLDRIDASRRYLINAKVEADDGTLWKMDRYWMDATGAKGASKLAAKKRYWMIIEKPDFFETVPGEKKLVVHAVAILDEIFP
jgi:hypothetical protein